MEKFREILKEIDPTIGEEELDGIISDVSLNKMAVGKSLYFRLMMMALER